MSLKEQIKKEIKEAMRAKDVTKRDTLRNLNTLIKQVEVDERRELNDSEVETILTKYLKQREDSLKQFKEAGREDLVSKEEAEIAIVKTYLPEPLSDDELKKIVKEIADSLNATSMKDMGRVMGEIKKRVSSRADGGKVNKFFKEIIS